MDLQLILEFKFGKYHLFFPKNLERSGLEHTVRRQDKVLDEPNLCQNNDYILSHDLLRIIYYGIKLINLFLIKG